MPSKSWYSASVVVVSSRTVGSKVALSPVLPAPLSDELVCGCARCLRTDRCPCQRCNGRPRRKRAASARNIIRPMSRPRVPRS
eukprot:7031319-Alexandrium_andersonii.AAC.1